MGGSFKWPTVVEVAEFRKKTRQVILDVIENTPLELPVTQDSQWVKPLGSCFKDMVDLCGCPQQKKNVMCYLMHNHHKLYIIGKVMKFTIQQKFFCLSFDVIGKEWGAST